jgi:hypothetical protein
MSTDRVLYKNTKTRHNHQGGDANNNNNTSSAAYAREQQTTQPVNQQTTSSTTTKRPKLQKNFAKTPLKPQQHNKQITTNNNSRKII